MSKDEREALVSLGGGLFLGHNFLIRFVITCLHSLFAFFWSWGGCRPATAPCFSGGLRSPDPPPISNDP